MSRYVIFGDSRSSGRRQARVPMWGRRVRGLQARRLAGLLRPTRDRSALTSTPIAYVAGVAVRHQRDCLHDLDYRALIDRNARLGRRAPDPLELDTAMAARAYPCWPRGTLS